MKIKKIISAMTVLAFSLSLISTVPVSANAESYPYTLFASSKTNGSITVNAENFCVNGSIATNGTINHGKNININGTKKENANEKMIYIFNKIESKFFSTNITSYDDDYVLNELNINIDSPVEVNGETKLTGNININSALKSIETITLDGDVKNTNDSLIFSKYGDIIIDSMNVNLNGLIYAPFGKVKITAQNLNLNNVIIISDTIELNSSSVNANKNYNMSEYIGNISESFTPPIDEYIYLPDTDNDYIPDIIEEEIGTNSINPDTDGDELLDGYEKFTTLTDPLISDSDGNTINDGYEDFDMDGLNNIGEQHYKTDPWYIDTDEDGLSDNDEVITYQTNPLKTDTDDDNLSDYDEVILNTNPLNPDSNGNGILDGDEHYNQEYIYTNENTSSVISKISITSNCTGNLNKTVSIEDISKTDGICAGVEGLIGEPFSIETTSTFEKAVLSFEVNETLLGDTDLEDIIFLWYNEEEFKFEELETLHDNENNTVSIETTHFSKYMIVDKISWLKAWNKQLNYTNCNYEKSICYSVLAIDCSGSMDDNDKIIDEIDKNSGTVTKKSNRADAVSNYIKTMDSDDKAAVLTFDDTSTVQIELTNDKDALQNSTSNFYSEGGTNFEEVINKSIDILKNSTGSTRKYIILLSDGISSISDDTLYEAKKANIKIFTIGLGNSNDTTLNHISTITEGEFSKAYSSDELLALYTKIGITKDFDRTDNDKDGLFDVIETVGIRIQNGSILYGCDPTNNDTDNDGKLDGVEIDPAIRWREDKQYYFFMKSNPLVDESYYDVRNHNFNEINGEYLLCGDCDFKVKSPIYQDKEILSEDDYLRVQSLYSEFNKEFINYTEKGDVSIADAENFYNNSIFIVEIEKIRSKTEYRGKYDYSDDANNYYSEVLASVNLDNIYYYRNGSVSQKRHCQCNIETIDETNIKRYINQYKTIPFIGSVMITAIGFSHPVIGSALTAAQNSADGRISTDETLWNMYYTLFGVFPISNQYVDLSKNIILSATAILQGVDSYSNSDIPQIGDKYVYINRGWECECNSRNCHFPSYTTVAEYIYRDGEIVYYSFGG